ncbi:hypothetical protein VYH82_03260 [Streptococcus anginosus]|uniref:hypothetical protein n=1 Tax=Streptococcus anginosus TaxID=1328 RepID=UPI001CD5728E|nr:hypothetical protein [Streptococcus anginosus]MED5833100.1 hypothetical protein [Streptococcus anginosus]MED5835054.1 hypothetical protein [Streptococcus anginosus]
MNTKQKYDLMMDASKLLRSLADVVESIAITYKDTSIIQADAKVIETQQVNALQEAKKLNLEDVRAVLAKLSQHGKTAEVKELIVKFGGTKLSDVPKENYSQLLKEAEEIKID